MPLLYSDTWVGGGSSIFMYDFQGALGIVIQLVSGKKDERSLMGEFYGISLEETDTIFAHISLSRS